MGLGTWTKVVSKVNNRGTNGTNSNYGLEVNTSQTNSGRNVSIKPSLRIARYGDNTHKDQFDGNYSNFVVRVGANSSSYREWKVTNVHLNLNKNAANAKEYVTITLNDSNSTVKGLGNVIPTKDADGSANIYVYASLNCSSTYAGHPQNMSGSTTFAAAAIGAAGYTVSYASGGHGTAPNSQTKAKGATLTLRGAMNSVSGGTYNVKYNPKGGTQPSNTTAAITYVFNKWRATDNTLYAAGGSYTKDASTTMTAVWTTSVASVATPSPTKNGYTFQGWSISSSATTVDVNKGDPYQPNADAILYAVWRANDIPSINITFNYPGTNISNSVMQMDKGGYALIPLKRQFYGDNVFAYFSDSNGKKYSLGDMISYNADTTLTAHWVTFPEPREKTFRVDKGGAHNMTVDVVGSTWCSKLENANVKLGGVYLIDILSSMRSISASGNVAILNNTFD